jgi:putative mycofactocin binding protein MftB
VTATVAEQDLLGLAWELAPGVALRPESFGALAYHFGTRRLTFLKTPELAAVVGSLNSHPTVRRALAAAGVERPEWNAYARALSSLADAGMIVPRDTEAS